MTGTLYVVATPIGNLGDLSPRARETLAGAELVAAEDTRRTGALLAACGLRRPLVSLHEHNEAARVEALLGRLREGAAVALVSDAGTPLVSDPGYRLVRAARGAGIPVVAVPGPSAVTAALSVAGLPTDRFCFEGFLPARRQARRARIEALRAEPRTVVLFESAHRITDTLADLAEILGGGREAAHARELTKRHEEVRLAPLEVLAEEAAARPERRLGEHVLVIAGAAGEAREEAELRRVLAVLLEELPPAQAARLAARLTGRPRPEAYAIAQALAARRG
ncbi:16S rRNA (cytidine(1402)-2'-O)-methyltransferase [Inmirania thermothiophila]|uniref:Ribosomal RNA small subunit methyltransferase I n=1 Tax=Inmirania thermothiophila TaxID=1750597 RepID=A0A3N1XSP7_9GAMM|nr:16S rRNA (cytidine(1402)-2'-O)-methyltransferase [Inmirania thermothiophila]ROR29673.1 16S rRNA (cytidine1402-2'-O)-methyltransferase [Inmirania thermothiophila]